MHLDVQDLRNFYYRSTLGRAAQGAVRREMLKMWPEAKGQTVVGFGFAVPLLRPYLPEARRVIGLMPAPQGVMPWPAGMPNVSVLSEETLWPIDTGLVDKLVLMHGLETTERPGELLQECFRVLGPGGKVLFIVPHRSGLWSRSDRTPFGYGRPYSQGQLEAQLKAHSFLPERHAHTLYQPPSHRRFWRKTAGFWERMGGAMSFVVSGGVLMVEASKRVHAPSGPGERVGRSSRLKVLEGLTAPRPKPETARTQGLARHTPEASAEVSAYAQAEQGRARVIPPGEPEEGRMWQDPIWQGPMWQGGTWQGRTWQGRPWQGRPWQGWSGPSDWSGPGCLSGAGGRARRLNPKLPKG